LTRNIKGGIIKGMDELLDRITQIERAIPTIKNKIARRDLLKMLRNVDASISAISQESVECRRLHKETLRYRELIDQTKNLITNLEQHLTFAALLSG
jgi:hypothetical protein